MGNKINVQSKVNTKQQAMKLKSYSKITVIGRGGFGKVWKVEHKKTRKLYAMKQMSKARVLLKKSVESVLNQLQLLKCLHHDFLINALFGFQDRENLYLIMDLVPGGDLRFHLIKNIRFNEEQTTCVIVGLEFLHNNGILHRDLKPQNLVFDKKGYLRITDLGVARIWKPQNSNDTSGTPGYMAPEVMCRSNHGVCVDYFALGVIMYECMFGYRPYTGSSRQDIRDKVLSRQVQIKQNQIPIGWSIESTNFINLAIQRKPQNRLGYNGPDQLISHKWFSDFDWDRFRRKSLVSPFHPVYNSDEYQDQLNAIKQVVIPPQTTILLHKQTIQNLFIDYEYDGMSVSNPLLEKIV